MARIRKPMVRVRKTGKPHLNRPETAKPRYPAGVIETPSGGRSTPGVKVQRIKLDQPNQPRFPKFSKKGS